ncbi:UNVERIFIED_CONTAM: Serine incorporator 2 [Sesamum latifolium]|uniref:Serine incorporator 2 n=1 Tax=Sesamum latifolium TaxID=2727402 RepID=A0AAW2XT98_9LAMI
MFRMGENGGSLEPRMMEPELGNNRSSQSEEQPASGQKSAKCSVRKTKSLRARYAYGVIFLLTNIIAWLFRDYGERILPVLPYSRACGAEERECYHTMGVLRVSLGCFFVLASPFSDYDYIQLYGELARVGAGVFLILQLISVIEFITWWNNYWMSDEKNKSSCSIGLFMSTVFYIASVCGIAVMYALYASKTSCSLNIFFISWTGVLLTVMMVISLHSRVNRGLLSSGIMASYIVFLCWTAIRSEPGSEKCSPQKQESGHGGWSTIVGFVIALCAIVIATFSTGIDSQTFQFRKNGAQLLEDDVPYSYGFFHLVFSLGAMYFAMLFISWNLGSLTRKWSIDVGWASTWVKIVNEWFAATIYCEYRLLPMWKLIFPVLKETKVMNHEDSTEEV